MIYKKHELSLSLNGEDIMHIARNAAGVVVFREHSEKALKRIIDESIKEQEYQEQLATEKKLEKEAKKNKRESQLDALETEFVETEVEQTLIPQKRVTRGPDGKFISKSQLDTDEDLKKKTFWDKLTS